MCVARIIIKDAGIIEVIRGMEDVQLEQVSSDTYIADVYSECDWLDLWDLHDSGKISMEELSRDI